MEPLRCAYNPAEPPVRRRLIVLLSNEPVPPGFVLVHVVAEHVEET